MNRDKLVDDLITEDNTTTIADYSSVVKEIEDVLRATEGKCTKCGLEITKDCEICW
jgi:hypothetical protein